MINFYKIDDKKFKGVYISLNFMTKIEENSLSKNAVLSSMLSKSNKKYKTEEEIEKYLASLYGANFNVNIEKYGDIENIEFKMLSINESVIDIKDKVVLKCIEFLNDMVFNTNINETDFDEELFAREKEFIIEKINARKDEKLKYGVNRTEELMLDGKGFGKYVYGENSQVKNLTKKDLIEAYNKLINDSSITLILSGNLSNYDNIEEDVKNIFKDKYMLGKDIKDLKYDEVSLINDNKEIIEKCDSTQSVVGVGFKIENVTEADNAKINMYNAILGSTPSSKLFQIFREKESLAYTTRSRFYRFKDMIIIYAGIEGKNYDKSKEVILRIMKSIEDGDISDEEFTAAKQSLIADLDEWVDSKAMQAKFLLTDLVVFKKFDRSVEDIKNEINKVTKEDVIEVAKKVKLKLWYFLGGEANE